MKKITYIVLLLMIKLSFSQVAGDDARISFGLYQDVNLATFEKGNGNTPFTTDVRFEVMLEDDSNYSGNFILGLTFEYADLSEFNFTRYGLQGGYNFRNYLLPFNLGYFDNAIYVGVGGIIRNFPEDSQTFMSLELTNEFAIFLTKWVSFNLKGTLMQRGDLGFKYDDPKGSYRPWDWGINVYGGFKIYIN